MYGCRNLLVYCAQATDAGLSKNPFCSDLLLNKNWLLIDTESNWMIFGESSIQCGQRFCTREIRRFHLILG